MVLPIKRTIIYGPINSRRLGFSLGINLTPQGKKYCDFDCLYCHYGKTEYHKLNPDDDDIFPEMENVLTEIEMALRSDVEFSYLTFSGNGEPTLYPRFKELTYEVNRLARKIRPYVKVTLLSNSSTCRRNSFIKSLEYIDLPIMKLDVGNPSLFKRINRPVEDLDFYEIVDGLVDLPNITIQSLFLEGDPDNTTDKALNDWFTCLQKIRPQHIQIYTLDRPFADKDRYGLVQIKKAPEEKMVKVVETGRERFGFKMDRY